jgi:hypothetical protein
MRFLILGFSPYNSHPMIALLLALLLQAKPEPPRDESVLVTVATEARLPNLAFDVEGNAYVAVVRNGNAELAISTDGGKTFGAPVLALDLKKKDIGIMNRGPRVAVDRAKRVYVSAPFDNGILLAVSGDRGKTFSKPTVIPDVPDAVHATAAGAGDVHVAWVATTNNARSLLYARFDSAGKRVGKPLTVTGLTCEHCPPALAVDPAGNPVLAWRESKPPRAVYLSRSADGGKSFAPATLLNSIVTGLTECPQEAPAAAFSPDGKTFGVAWMDRRDVERDADIYWSFGPPGKLSADTDCLDDRRYQQRRPAIAIDGDGAAWCAWEDGRLSGLRVFYTHSRTDLNIPLGDAKEGSGSWPSVAAAGGKVAIAYQLGKDVGFRILVTR